MTTRPNCNASITNHRQFNAFAAYFTERVAEIVCRPTRPIEKHVNTDKLFLRRRFRAGCTRRRLLAFAVFPRFQNLRCLPESLNNSLCKLLRPNLLLTDFFVVDVVRMNAVFNRTQPRIVHALGVIGQPDMDQHHNGAEQQSRRIREILTGAPRR